MPSDISTLVVGLLAQSTDSREDERYFRVSLHIGDDELADINKLTAALKPFDCHVRWAVTFVDTYDEAYELDDENICGAERTVIMKKSNPTDKSVRFFRLKSFCDWASAQPANIEHIRRAFIADLCQDFSTGTCVFTQWTAQELIKSPESDENYCSPSKVVRTSHVELCPSSVRTWSPNDCQSVPEDFAHLCINFLARSLAPELRQENERLSVFIRGARAHEVRFERSNGPADRALLAELVAATEWIFRSEKEADLRHGLLASEIAREWEPYATWLSGLSSRLPFALKNAETAYSLHLHELGSDALEQMGMLRRALSDDAGRLSALMSSIQGALWRDTAIGAGFIVLRLSGTEVPSIAAIAVLVYLLVSVIVNWLNIMSVLSVVAREGGRTRKRLYHFVQQDDFKEIYSDPVGRIRQKLWVVFALSGFVSFILGVLILFTSGLLCSDSSKTADATVPHAEIAIPSPAPDEEAK